MAPPDTEMVDAVGNQDAPDSVENAPSDEETKTNVVPPLQASAFRLERLLGGSKGGATSGVEGSYTNPVKVVRRWLATSSGAAADATADDIQMAAKALLDPNGSCARGRHCLLGTGSDAAVGMEVESESAAMSSKSSRYLKFAAREVESWLISLASRLLWKEKKYVEAFELCQRGIVIIMAHLEEASSKITSVSAPLASSLFPLLARLYRLRSLNTEAMKDAALNANLRAEMAKAHNMASLRRDVDTQATLLNCMLRDLLEDSQGM